MVHHYRGVAGDEIKAAYRYDGLSRRILKQVLRGDTLSTTRFGWDGDRQCAEVGEDWLRTTVHEPGGFVPLLRLEQARAPDPLELIQARRLLASQGQALPEAYRPPVDALRLACFHTDHLGTPLRLTGEDGQLRWQAEPDDWAAVRAERGDTNQPIRFQGQYHDEESGLYYNRYRYYAPEFGRYVSQDPLGLLGGMNGYIYSEINPSHYSDPLGLSPFAGAGGMSNQQLGSYAQAQAAINSVSAELEKIKGMITWDNPFAPDYVSAEIDVYFASGSIIYTRYGDLFTSGGIVRGYPSSAGGANISAGYLVCPAAPDRKELNDFLGGWASGAGYYDGVGVSVVANSAGTAVNVGAGLGKAGASLGSNSGRQWGISDVVPN
ncbi:RHS repeat-associated core domain-containing protein [Pseudomonas mangiferae]|uniref:RHS repeat-associated core domain-containing protein n=1 Tax=Pseudomonas mangiferae TaxID=2593654 RepID=A0A553GVC2_9PSED|nr:RHS repeat-associated core domain-containing protein [Pseudomonas mangiferae]